MQRAFKDIIELLKESSYTASILDATCEYVNLGKAIEIVKQAAAEHNNGWIPCSERLPEETTHYLVTTDNHTKAMYAWWKRSEKRWFYFNSDVEMMDVVAWQPLPEPYQPKGE